jgi:Domain of unknown function (DUF4258)
MAERQIRQEWVERILTHPEQTVPDKVDPDLQHALGRIKERDDRVLRAWSAMTTLILGAS